MVTSATNNLDMTYSIAESGNTFNLSGQLSFQDSLTNSFPVVENFILKMNFLDDNGKVLETIDISPMVDFTIAPSQIPIKASAPGRLLLVPLPSTFLASSGKTMLGQGAVLQKYSIFRLINSSGAVSE